jgi:hypothetical protein
MFARLTRFSIDPILRKAELGSRGFYLSSLFSILVRTRVRLSCCFEQGHRTFLNIADYVFPSAFDFSE